MQIRESEEGDSDAVVDVCESTGLFGPDETATLKTLLADFNSFNHARSHHLLVCETANKLVGVVYFHPREMTDRTWELLMIMVKPAHQGQGVGSLLLQAFEAKVRDANARLLLVETISLPDFEPVRRFYRRHGFLQVGEIGDYYADGVGKVTFAKRL